MPDLTSLNRVNWLMQRARRMLSTARLVFDHGDFASAVNRAYYAFFYAANAALSTRGLERHKHTGVLAEFRVQFVKTGLIEPEYSAFYGDTMDARHAGDYDFTIQIEPGRAVSAIDEAERFVNRIAQFLEEQGDDFPTAMADPE